MAPQHRSADLRSADLNFPSSSEQEEIMRRVEGLFALADQLEERLAKACGQAWPAEALRRRLDQLTPSLPPSPSYGGTGLARAFAGQLVPQDPTDEPAEKSLERIKAARPRE